MSNMCCHSKANTTATDTCRYTAASAPHFACACLAEAAARKDAHAHTKREWQASLNVNNPESKCRCCSGAMSSTYCHITIDTRTTDTCKYSRIATQHSCASLAEAATRREKNRLAKAEKRAFDAVNNPDGKCQLGLSCRACVATIRLTPLQLTPADTPQHQLLTLLVHALQRLQPGRRPRHKEPKRGGPLTMPATLKVSVSSSGVVPSMYCHIMVDTNATDACKYSSISHSPFLRIPCRGCSKEREI